MSRLRPRLGSPSFDLDRSLGGFGAGGSSLSASGRYSSNLASEILDESCLGGVFPLGDLDFDRGVLPLG